MVRPEGGTHRGPRPDGRWWWCGFGERHPPGELRHARRGRPLAAAQHRHRHRSQAGRRHRRRGQPLHRAGERGRARRRHEGDLHAPPQPG
ncbi:MAG: hypothetical protein EBU23_17355 [Mycobacteriaceae bacterium]|nr:hypothetical protein [Mycobacteriaceae bacterium]